MSGLVEVRCTACKTPLKFRRKSTATVALTCPKCSHLFEVQVRQPVLEVAPIKAVEVVQPIPSKPVTATPKASMTSQASIVDNLTANELPAPTLPGRPVVRPKTRTARKRTKSDSGITPFAAIFAGLAGVAFLLLLVIVFATDFGQSMIAGLTSNTSTPEGIARKRNALIGDCLDAVRSVEEDTERQQAANALISKRESFGELVYSSVSVDSIDDTRRRTIQQELQKGDTLLAESNLDLDRLVAGREDALASEIQHFRDTSEAIKLLLTEVALVLREPTEREEQICYDGIVLEKKVLQQLASIRTSAEVEPSLREIQALIDEFNQLAETQYQSGYRVSFPPRDYDRVEVAIETARRWLIEDIEQNIQPEREFEITMKDFDYVQNRFDNALFKSSIVMLDSTSRQRVQNEIATTATPDSDQYASSQSYGQSRPSSSDLAANYDERPNSDHDLTDSSFDQFGDPGYADPYNSDSFASDPYGAPDYGTGRPYDNSDVADELISQSPNASNPFDPDNTLPGSGAPGGIGRNVPGAATNSPRGSAPGGRNASGDRGRTFGSPGFGSNTDSPGDSMEDSLSSPSGSGRFGNGSLGRQTPGAGSKSNIRLLTGRSSLTVRIFNGNNLNGDQLLKRMGTKIGAKQPRWLHDQGELVLNFEYSGSLQDASKAVDFGSVDLSDSQSRTLFVTAE